MNFEKINQIIGCAYTFAGSLAVRKVLTKDSAKHHSSQTSDFSYFFKGNKYSVVGTKEFLRLRKHPLTEKPADHWPEPEIAMLLGKNHKIKCYCLANDFTAIGIEKEGRSKKFDGTYYGKYWKGSCSLGPKFVPAKKIDSEKLKVGLKIERNRKTIYDNKFSVKNRLRDFKLLPNKIIEYRKTLEKPLPKSKRIKVTENGLLPAGTVILTGAITVVPPKCFSLAGDIITVYSPQLGKLKNKIIK